MILIGFPLAALLGTAAGYLTAGRTDPLLQQRRAVLLHAYFYVTLHAALAISYWTGDNPNPWLWLTAGVPLLAVWHGYVWWAPHQIRQLMAEQIARAEQARRYGTR